MRLNPAESAVRARQWAKRSRALVVDGVFMVGWRSSHSPYYQNAPVHGVDDMELLLNPTRYGRVERYGLPGLRYVDAVERDLTFHCGRGLSFCASINQALREVGYNPMLVPVLVELSDVTVPGSTSYMAEKGRASMLLVLTEPMTPTQSRRWLTQARSQLRAGRDPTQRPSPAASARP